MLLAIFIAAFATLNRNATILLFFVLPIQARWFLWLEVLFAFIAFLGSHDLPGFLGITTAVLRDLGIALGRRAGTDAPGVAPPRRALAAPAGARPGAQAAQDEGDRRRPRPRRRSEEARRRGGRTDGEAALGPLTAHPPKQIRECLERKIGAPAPSDRRPG